jgi:2-polyprenyl-6-methoxyphenol hydroxylase-like FAD-dependent oxidoreductase
MAVNGRSHAIVIGGSMAGLCAARALSAHFERVTLIERDRLPLGIEHRPGVPQSHHVHALLLRGALELERLFPGIQRDFGAAGASRMDLGSELAYCSEWGWVPPAAVEVAPLTLSRVLIEGVVRSHVRADIRNLTLLDATRITGLISERNGDYVRVTGVSTSHAQLRELHADLVVDASGRNSKCLEWLAAQGIERPEEELVDAHGGYASRFYELAPNPKRWWRGMLIDPRAPARRRWGLLMPIENGRWVLTLAGMNREYPPSDEQGFHEYLNSLPSQAMAREIARAKPISSIHAHRALSNRARHFERWSQRVGGFVTMGDAAVAFNAYHGQGMSMAAVSANTLGDTLSKFRSCDAYALTRHFHKAQWKQLQLAWQIATEIDLEWPGTEGKRPFGYSAMFALGVSAVRASHEIPHIKRLLGPVYQLVAPRYTLLRPDLFALVIYAELRRRIGLPVQHLPAIDSTDFAQLHLDAAHDEPRLQERAQQPQL